MIVNISHWLADEGQCDVMIILFRFANAIKRPFFIWPNLQLLWSFLNGPDTIIILSIVYVRYQLQSAVLFVISGAIALILRSLANVNAIMDDDRDLYVHIGLHSPGVSVFALWVYIGCSVN